MADEPHFFSCFEQPDRRGWLRSTVAGLCGLLPLGCRRELPSERVGWQTQEKMRFPGKVAMRVVNSRPPCLETPWRYFREDFTPNEAFYVRWHLQMLPTEVDLRTWRLRLGGAVERPLEWSLDELRRFEPTSVVAVNQCSGNSRGFVTPHMTGAQWYHGAMGNARWTGVPLRTLLDRAGVRKEAVEVTFRGLDRGGIPTVPDIERSLKIDFARQPGLLVAYAMNDQPLPLLNGFPVRLVVPGWYATYWIKSLTDINIVTQPFEGYWMMKAYRIPTTPHAFEEPSKLAAITVPLSRMNVRSFITSPDEETPIPAGRPYPLEGIAFDGGDGIRQVEVSTDGGTNWRTATLGTDHGSASFRRWRLDWTPTPGAHEVQVRATSNSGETQPAQAGWNHGGYLRNVIETLRVTARV